MKIRIRRMDGVDITSEEIDLGGLLAIEFDFENGQRFSVGSAAGQLSINASGDRGVLIIEPVASNAVRISTKR